MVTAAVPGATASKKLAAANHWRRTVKLGFDIVNDDFTDYVTDGPEILLGPETTRNRVVINEDDAVEDHGTDNIIIVR